MGDKLAIRTLLFIFCLFTNVHGLEPNSLPQVGYHPGGLSYWSVPYFSNALYNGKWLEFESGQWGNDIDIWKNPQFDENGYPQYLEQGKYLRAICFGLHTDYGSSRPDTWPKRSNLAQGHVVLAWQGQADIRLNRGSFIADESNGSETGLINNGRRTYLFDNGNHLETLEVYAINSSNPIRDIKVWLSDPNDPNRLSLEDQLYHPILYDRLADSDWGFIRFMDLLQTNTNPQQDWIDRRHPSHCFMTGKLNPRPPAEGYSGNRGSGMAFEFMTQLCNQSEKDLWICIPHMATDDFIYKLAQLIRFGSDGKEPYTHEVENPVYPPLNIKQRVFIEYSNEIWSWGDSFAQGQWAYDQATEIGITKPQFNARRFCRTWQIFQDVFNGTERLVRVASVFTANESYTKPFIQEMAIYGPNMSPPVEPDVIAVTTYFGNGIQDFVYETALKQVDTNDPWFLTSETFQSGNVQKNISLPPDDTYWKSESFEHHLKETFLEWRKRLLSGDAREGSGPDAVGIGGGFDLWLRELAQNAFDKPKPIIAYEGGPSLYTNDIDSGDSRDDGLTMFMEAMNRHEDFYNIYNIHLNMAKSKGLWTHVIFTDCSTWGKYGQWGHLEYFDQQPEDSVKWQFILDYISGMSSLQHIDQPVNNRPEFVTGHILPVAIVGQPYSATIHTSGGDGVRTIKKIGDNFETGLYSAISPNDFNSLDIFGIPEKATYNYLYLRVNDEDGDPAWRTFTIQSVGGPNTLIETDFSGTNIGNNLPWTKTYILADELTYSGWQAGAGIQTHPGDNALRWSVNAPADENESTLALAISDNEYLSMQVRTSARSNKSLDLRNAKVTFGLRRVDYHAPRKFVVLTNIEGFTEDKAIFISSRNGSTEDMQYSFTLPNNESYSEIKGTFELRIYGFSGQYGGHKAELYNFNLEGKVLSPDEE